MFFITGKLIEPRREIKYTIKKQCPNGTLAEHTLLFLKVLCVFLGACLLLSHYYPPIH